MNVGGSELPSAGLTLDPEIEVLPGTDIASVWERFEVFEALHHSLTICNPMTSEELGETISAVDALDGFVVLDVGCGYGEVLMRTAKQAAIAGIGIDLSPWMITQAQARVKKRSPGLDVRWVLGDAKDYALDTPPDVAYCLGAEWVWHDFRGTARALANRLGRDGTAVIGAARLHHGADPDAVRSQRGHVDTVDDMAAALDEFGLRPYHRIDPDDAGWDAYLARTADAAAEWAVVYPGERSDKWLEEQADWQAARERDRDIIGWSVWIAQKQ